MSDTKDPEIDKMSEHYKIDKVISPMPMSDDDEDDDFITNETFSEFDTTENNIEFVDGGFTLNGVPISFPEAEKLFAENDVELSDECKNYYYNTLPIDIYMRIFEKKEVESLKKEGDDEDIVIDLFDDESDDDVVVITERPVAKKNSAEMEILNDIVSIRQFEMSRKLFLQVCCRRVVY